MAQWAYLQSDEHRKEVVRRVLDEATEGDPPWEQEDMEIDGASQEAVQTIDQKDPQ